MSSCLTAWRCAFLLQTGGTGGFDLAGLLNNPSFMSMVSVCVVKCGQFALDLSGMKQAGGFPFNPDPFAEAECTSYYGYRAKPYLEAVHRSAGGMGALCVPSFGLGIVLFAPVFCYK